MSKATKSATSAPSADIVAAIADLDFDTISNDDRMDAIIAVERHIAWLTAMQHRLISELRSSLLGVSSDDDWVQEELGTALRLAPTTAGARLNVARALVRRLPATLATLEAGNISPTQAADIACATSHLGPVQAEMVENRILPRAVEQSAGQTRRALKRAVLCVDPAGAAEREATAVQQRRVVLVPAEDGMADVHAHLPAAGARALMTAIRGLADSNTAHDARTLDQRQADTLVDLGFAVLDSGAMPAQHGRPTRLGLSVTAETLTGNADTPAQLDGYGPLSADAARKLIRRFSDGGGISITACPVNNNGQLRSPSPPGTKSYQLPATLRQFVLARDRRCTFPHCAIPASRCDLDHIVAYSAGGGTDADNLHPLCRRHHRAKHQAGWQVQRGDRGVYKWTAPSGERYQSVPPAYPVDDVLTEDVELLQQIRNADRFLPPEIIFDPSWVPWNEHRAA